MQSTDYLKPTEFWWPSPEAFDDLAVEDSKEGFILDAPDSTECGDWLAYWNQSPNHIELFTEEFTKCLQNHIDATLEEHGQTQSISNGIHEDGEQA
jgi:hypothetical protein